MNRFLTIAGLFTLVALVGCEASSKKSSKTELPAKGLDPSPVTLQVVKFADLLKAVDEQKGKVVVIDVWGDFCPPCKTNFHHLVEMHEKYGKDGVVCMSASVDPYSGKEKKETFDACLKFLTAKNARFANYLVDDKAKVWQDHWGVVAVPAVMVYDQSGKLTKFTWDDADNQFTYPDVEKYVASLIAKK